MRRTLSTLHKGHHFFVENTWFGGMTLKIDGVLVSRNDAWVHPHRDVPFIELGHAGMNVTIYVEALMDIKMVLMVDGKVIAATHPDALAVPIENG